MVIFVCQFQEILHNYLNIQLSEKQRKPKHVACAKSMSNDLAGFVGTIEGMDEDRQPETIKVFLGMTEHLHAE